MKKKLLSIFLAVCMTLSFAACLDMVNSSNNAENSESKEYIDPTSIDSDAQPEDKDNKVELNVLVEENLIFAKYSVNVIVDGKTLKTLGSSKNPEELDLKLTEGSHTFRFEKKDDPKIYVEITETVSGNHSFSYALKRHEDKIDLIPQIKVVLNVTVEKNIAMAKYAVDFYVDLSEYTTITDNNAGESKKIVVLLDKGTHTFGFAKNDDYSVLASMEETFSEDTTYNISIKRHKSRIEMSSEKK